MWFKSTSCGLIIIKRWSCGVNHREPIFNLNGKVCSLIFCMLHAFYPTTISLSLDLSLCGWHTRVFIMRDNCISHAILVPSLPNVFSPEFLAGAMKEVSPSSSSTVSSSLSRTTTVLSFLIATSSLCPSSSSYGYILY